MAERGEHSLWVLMPPEFEYLAGLFIPDQTRARLAGRVTAAVARYRDEGHPLFFDPGTDGYTARKIAARLARESAASALMIGSCHDAVGAKILYQALADAGISCAGPLITDDADEVVSGLQQALPGLSPIDLPPAVPSSQECTLIIDPRVGSPAGIGGTALIGLTLPVGEGESDEGRKAWLHTASEFIGSIGANRCRLVGLPAPPDKGFRHGGAAWALRYGIADPSLRPILLELTAAHFPPWLGLLRVAIILYESGVDPQEEMYAGNSLVDRNAELLVNIVP